MENITQLVLYTYTNKHNKKAYLCEKYDMRHIPEKDRSLIFNNLLEDKYHEHFVLGLLDNINIVEFIEVTDWTDEPNENGNNSNQAIDRMNYHLKKSIKEEYKLTDEDLERNREDYYDY